MEKDKNMVRVIQLALVMGFVGFCSCCNSIEQGKYYQYYIGTMKIKNPILVQLEEQSNMWYVCPDSALYCCNDLDWLCRDDVFPYLPIVEFNSLLRTYYPRKELSQMPYFQWDYFPFYESERINNHTIFRFYYDVNTFECYMQATNESWLDWDDDIDIGVSKFEQIDVEPNYISNRNPNCESNYKMVVRQKHNIFQIMRLKRKYRNFFDSNH